MNVSPKFASLVFAVFVLFCAVILRSSHCLSAVITKHTAVRMDASAKSVARQATPNDAWLHLTPAESSAASGKGPHTAPPPEASHTAPLDSWSR